MLALTNPRYSGDAFNGLGSGRIWSDLPANIDEAGKGFHIYLNGSDLPKHTATGSAVTEKNGPLSVYLDAGGYIRTPTVGAADPGLQIGSDGDNELVSWVHGGGRALVAATAPKLWYECEVKSSTIAATQHEWINGIADHAALPATNVFLDDSDAIADQNILAFRKVTAGGGVNVVYKADGQTAATHITTITTLVADTYVRLGFKLDPRAPVAKRVTFYVNGAEYTTTYLTTTTLALATFPSDVNMSICGTVNNTVGSNTGFMTFKWARLAQAAA